MADEGEIADIGGFTGHQVLPSHKVAAPRPRSRRPEHLSKYQFFREISTGFTMIAPIPKSFWIRLQDHNLLTPEGKFGYIRTPREDFLMNLLFPLNRLFPPSPVWRELYAAAVNINKLAPWEWMYDADIFGVQNPVNGEIAYCCILGGLGEVFGLVAYLGTEGLESYYKLSEQREPVFELFCHQKCLSITFDRRESLVKQE
ncbi:MAG: hypothetical protein FJ126_12625, partial [Deltaproteobacteria bacterium]|nr:hypothetical protein [Deltaproteobacteria bacterium]